MRWDGESGPLFRTARYLAGKNRSMSVLCRVEMLGRIRAVLPTGPVDRFRTQKAAWILAYLALRPGQRVPRERLVDLLWPEVDLPAGRDNLKNALSTLRRQIEPPGVEPGSVLVADRLLLGLNSGAVSTDVEEFERALRKSDAAEGTERLQWLQSAVDLYVGDLLPGCYEEWASLEQRRLHERYIDAVQRLGDAYEAAGDLLSAIQVIERGLAADEYREPLYASAIRIHLGRGQAAAAVELYQSMERRYREELDALPPAEIRSLVEGISPMRLSPASPLVPPPSPAPAPATPPTPRPERQVTSIPLPLSRFFGRGEERAQLEALILRDRVRLVSLLGPGGVGKTRLSIEVARDLEPKFSGRVVWVGLAVLDDPQLIADAIARAMKLPTSGTDPNEAIISALADQDSLLVLDNLEQLLDDRGGGLSLDATTDWVRSLLEAVPNLQILATSRSPLRIQGETEFHLGLLPVPEITSDADQVLATTSGSLYLDRARQSRPDFTVNANNASDVARLCRALEGLPLAIEMAAAWAKLFPPARMLERIQGHVDNLSSRRRDLPARQRSLFATIEWSYDLIDPRLQRLLMTLSVFRGGWDADAAAKVAGDGANPDELLSDLVSLMEKSLVVCEDEEDKTRYRMLESIRQFAEAKLRESGDQAATRGRHFAYFRDMAEASWATIRSAQQVETLDQLQLEHDNFRSALEWVASPDAVEHAPQDGDVDLASWLRPFWDMRGHWREGCDRLEKALLRSEGHGRPDVRARALIGLGVLAGMLGEYEKARAAYTESLDIRSRLGDIRGQASVATGLGNLETDLGNWDEAQRWGDRALRHAQELGDQLMISGITSNLGRLAHERRDFPMAKTLSERSLSLCTELGDLVGMAGAHINLARTLIELKEYPPAAVHLAAGLELGRHNDDVRIEYNALLALGRLCFLFDQTETGMFFLHACGRLMDQTGAQRTPEFEALLRDGEALLGTETAQAIKENATSTETEEVLLAAEEYLARTGQQTA